MFYVLIKDFNRFMTNKSKHHGKQHPWWYCLQCFWSSKLLEVHVKNCLAISHTKTITLDENAYLRLQNFQRLLKAPFTIYSNFESILILASNWK